MSKIHNTISELKLYGVTISFDDIIDQFTIHDIKEYIRYLEQEIIIKDETIKSLITENVKLKVKFGVK